MNNLLAISYKDFQNKIYMRTLKKKWFYVIVFRTHVQIQIAMLLRYFLAICLAKHQPISHRRIYETIEINSSCFFTCSKTKIDLNFTVTHNSIIRYRNLASSSFNRLTTSQHSISFAGPKIWNKLPLLIRQLTQWINLNLLTSYLGNKYN